MCLLPLSFPPTQGLHQVSGQWCIVSGWGGWIPSVHDGDFSTLSKHFSKVL